MHQVQCQSAFLNEESESTLVGKLHFEERTLDDVRRVLCTKRDALPNNVRRLRVHQHIGLTRTTLHTLEKAFSFKTTTLVSCFVDTKDFRLARNNMWLVYQEGIWTLKSCEDSTDENFVIFHSEQNLVKIEEQVARLLGTQRARIPQLCPHRYAIIRTTRRTYDVSSPACSIYIDFAEVARKDFYLVGTMSLAAENDSLVSSAWPQMDPHAIFSPVRSRVVESLYINNKAIYDELVDVGALPAGDFYSRPGLNRYTSDLFRSDLPRVEVRLPCDDSSVPPPCYTKPDSFPVPDRILRGERCSKKQEALLAEWNSKVQQYE